jgi:2-keto-3-deoxy-L-rhamnonate aldolase RhmA
MNAFRRLLAEAPSGRMPIGTWLMSASPLVAEAAGCAGFDWAVVDMEHAPLDLGTVVHLLQAIAGTPMLPIVRVPWNDAVVVKRVLDAGAETLLFPFVQSAEEAQRAVAATRYPPEGIRGMANMSRASRFGTAPDHYENANRAVGVIVQLETPAAIAELEAMAALPGIDAFLIGPADLSGAMGLTGQTMHPDVVAAITDAVARCHAAGKPVATIGGSVDDVRRYRAIGFDTVAVGSDLGLMVGAAQTAIAALRGDGPAAKGRGN